MKSSRGGHAQGHLREALIDALEEGWVEDRPWWELVSVEFGDRAWQLWWDRTDFRNRAGWLLGQLRNCTEVIPSGTSDLVTIPCGSSFATLVRTFREDMESLDLESSGPRPRRTSAVDACHQRCSE
jgi:hypothetical protein